MTVSINILHQSEDWVIVSKPPNLLMHSHPRFPGAETLIDNLQEQLNHQLWIVHRLDRSASGVLIVAKKRAITQTIKEALAMGEKTYIAMVRGYFTPNEKITIETPIKHNGKHKPAKSVITWLGRSHDPRCSLLKVQPHTGRNHQVRRHCRDLTHPILLDATHGDCKVNRWWRKNYNLQRLGLHSLKLSMVIKSQLIEGFSPIYSDHYNVFSKMPWWEEAQAKESGLTARPFTTQQSEDR